MNCININLTISSFLETLAELGKRDFIIFDSIIFILFIYFGLDIKMERIMMKNRCSTDFCITLVLRDVFIVVLLLFISDADLLGSRTEKVGRKMSLAQPCATCVPHVT